MRYTAGMREWVKDASRSMPGRNWVLHVCVWLVCLGLFIEMFQSNSENTSLVLFPIATLSFGLHELAHVATSFLPDIVTAAAGSLSELLFAIALIFIAYKKRAYITTFVLTLWYLFASLSAGRYMADARSQLLPLVSIASAVSDEGEATHDWHFVFSKLGMLNADVFIGAFVKAGGVILALLGLSLYVYCIYRMKQKSAPIEQAGLVASKDKLPVATVAYSNDPKEYKP